MHTIPEIVAQDYLTVSANLPSIYSVVATAAAGICTPNIGPKRPQYNVVFLCPSITPTALRPRVSVMVGCIGQPLKRLAGSFAGSANPIQSTAQ